MESSAIFVGDVKQELERSFVVILPQEKNVGDIKQEPANNLHQNANSDTVIPSERFVGVIKQEPAIDLDQIENSDIPDKEKPSERFVGDIKHEPERHFVLILPHEPESVLQADAQKKFGATEFNIDLKKFDGKWKAKAVMFAKYFRCEKCDFPTQTARDMNQHFPRCKGPKNQTNAKRIFACCLCEMEFTSFESKGKHERSEHRKGSTWQCSKCPRQYTYRSQILNHYSIHNKKFSCETCLHKYPKAAVLELHQTLHRHGVYANKSVIKFDCELCVKSFLTKHSLGSHTRTVHNTFKRLAKQSGCHCDICGKEFRHKDLIKQHMNIHCKIPCPICKHLLSRFRFKEHVEQHTSTTTYKCDVCEKVYRNRQDLLKHKLFHNVDEVQCDICGRTYENKLRLRVHLKYHMKASCPVCQHKTTRAKLSLHIKQHSSATYDCKVCGKVFRGQPNLGQHMRLVHTSERYQCDLCIKIFKDKRSLIRHLETDGVHKAEEAIKCRSCKKTFNKRSKLTCHVRSCFKIPCLVCKRPTGMSRIKEHMQRYHSDKNLICNIKFCRKKFMNTNELKEHQEIHIGPGRYKCPKCNFEKTKLTNITQHIRSRIHRL